MKRMICATVMAVALVSAAAAQGAPLGEGTFAGRLDLRVGIARLAEIAGTGDQASLAEYSGETAVLLFGTLSHPTITNAQPFEAVVEFLEGEWVGTSSILLHRVYLVFKGDGYREFLDGSSGRRTVVIARDPSIRVSPDGARDVYLNVISLRPIF